ncbi:MAG: hypothetical protein SH850_20920 [Planctomycetaceae bacterium]|nr:hypothetical protein [Planctomycetaceae bacterium]
MMSREQLELYRRMTTSERLALTLKMIAENEPALLHGPPEVVRRRFELLEKQNNERNQRILETLYPERVVR